MGGDGGLKIRNYRAVKILIRVCVTPIAGSLFIAFLISGKNFKVDPYQIVGWASHIFIPYQVKPHNTPIAINCNSFIARTPVSIQDCIQRQKTNCTELQ